MEVYVYLIAFVAAMPIIWLVLLASNFEKCFKQGKILQIRIAYVLVTLIGSHLLASLIKTLATLFTK